MNECYRKGKAEELCSMQFIDSFVSYKSKYRAYFEVKYDYQYKCIFSLRFFNILEVDLELNKPYLIDL